MSHYHVLRAALAAGFALGLCTAGATAAELTVRLRDPGGAAVEDAVLWLETSDGRRAPPAAPRRAEIRQRDREFLPPVTVVQTGTQIEFPNLDKLKHHVYSFSPAKTFEIQLYAGNPASPVLFDKPGLVTLGCNIHDWMQAFVMVVDTPWFAKTDGVGQARIERLPAGRYVLHAWHARQRTELPAQEIELAARDTRDLPLELTLGPPPKRKPRPPLDQDY